MAIKLYIFFSPGDVLAGEAPCQDEALLEVDHQEQLFGLFEIFQCSY